MVAHMWLLRPLVSANVAAIRAALRVDWLGRPWQPVLTLRGLSSAMAAPEGRSMAAVNTAAGYRARICNIFVIPQLVGVWVNKGFEGPEKLYLRDSENSERKCMK